MTFLGDQLYYFTNFDLISVGGGSILKHEAQVNHILNA